MYIRFALLNDDVLKSSEAFEVFKLCMYLPTREKYKKEVNSWLNGNNIKAYGCYLGKLLKAIIVVNSVNNTDIKIIGISVCEDCRNKGLGTYMIQKIKEEYSFKRLLAETDNDAVDFYKKCGFEVSNTVKKFDGREIMRYSCIL